MRIEKRLFIIFFLPYLLLKFILFSAEILVSVLQTAD